MQGEEISLEKIANGSVFESDVGGDAEGKSYSLWIRSHFIWMWR